MKHVVPLLLVLLGASLACESVSSDKGSGSLLAEDSGLEGVSILAKGME